MTPREELSRAKRTLETAERKLTDARFLRERLQRVLLSASDDMRPSLENALSNLTAAQPRLEAEFDACFDCLRAIAFVAGLDPDRMQIRSLDAPKGPRKASVR
jgi:hypothetical protein